jgi:hypothetical protein
LKKHLILAVALVMAASVASAQNSKATAAINAAYYCNVTNTSTTSTVNSTAPMTCHNVMNGNTRTTTSDNFVVVMSAPVKLSASQSLFVSPSLVTGLYTNTTTKSKSGAGRSTAVAMGGVYERAVLINQNTGTKTYAYPVEACGTGNYGLLYGCESVGRGYGVVLDSRVQTLTTNVTNCLVTAGGTCSVEVDTQLVLDTTSAHTFNFIFPNVGQGTYTVQIQDAVNSSASVPNGKGYAIAGASFGLGSVTIQTVRLVHGFSF